MEGGPELVRFTGRSLIGPTLGRSVISMSPVLAVFALLAVDVDTMRQGAVVAIAVIVLLGLIAFKVFVNTVVRIITVVVVVALGAAIWSQRASLQDCADQVGDLRDLDVSDVQRGSVTCTFFGVEVDVPIPVPGA